MPTKKNPNTALAQTLGAAPAAPSEPKAAKPKNVKNPDKTGVSDVAGKPEKSVDNHATDAVQYVLGPGQAQVVASLVQAGYSYQEAVAMLNGEKSPGRPAPAPTVSPEEKARIKKLADGDDSDLPPVEDVPEKYDVVDFNSEKRDGFKTLADDFWARREDLEDLPKKTKFRVVIEMDAPELDWLLHRNIQEMQFRKDPSFSLNRTVGLLLKQQKNLDPTRGGRRQSTSTGPKSEFNPKTGDWTK